MEEPLTLIRNCGSYGVANRPDRPSVRGSSGCEKDKVERECAEEEEMVGSQ